MWNDLIKVKHIYVKGRVLRLGNGKNIDFWNDIWCGPLSLKDKKKLDLRGVMTAPRFSVKKKDLLTQIEKTPEPPPPS